ncbi:TonB-dependent siderophore receptor [Aliarcobacter butzleri]|uniref:TonB-dependent siderophore receptor n=1 Tax=Aliarcobacter butzleri TaxID=28197 RepID=UPI001EDC928F|nr:TonB-dependent receptor [Aliarcobacter butzleri]MCG3657965.1 TonB-dependent siderophore receptor [Aliarcobacter butzleri]
MNLFKKSLLSPAVALLICSNIYADNISYSMEKQSLKDAIEKISKKANKPYIASGEIFDGKTSNAIKDITGTQNALDEVLKNSGLEAVLEDGAIIIKKLPVIGQGTVLEPISVNESYKNGTAENGYLSEDITGVGLWGKRSLQDTPYSMTVIPKDLIENSVAVNMSQIFKMNPLTQDMGRQYQDQVNVSLRGFSGNPPIIDGIPYALSLGSMSMEEIERVEIINGTSGFLYGGGRVGGAVNYVIKSPTQQDLRNITIGNYGGEQYYSHIDLGGKFDEKGKFGYRVNLMYEDGETPVNNIDKEQKVASVALDWNITDNVYADIKYNHRYYKSNNQIAFAGFSGKNPNLDVGKQYKPDWANDEKEHDRVIPSLEWVINDIFTLRTSAFYEEGTYNLTMANISYSGNGLYDQSFWNYGEREFKSYGGNIYLDSEFSFLNIEHLLTIGYAENYSDFSFSADGFLGYTKNDISLEQAKNTVKPDWASIGSLGTYPKIKTGDTIYKNILVGDDITFNEQWSAMVGVNYATVINESYHNTVGGTNNGELDTKYDKSELTPTLSLIYKPFENLSTYVTYMESLEQGTIVQSWGGAPYTNEGEVLQPLKSKQYEIGAKYSISEDLLLSSALFRIEKPNQYSNNAIPQPTYVQDGEQIHQGIELIATGKVTNDLTVMTGVTLMDLSVESSNDKNLEGKKPTDAASKMAKIYAEYEIPQVKGLFLTGGAYYTGKKYANETNTNYVPSYTLFDAGLRYKTKLDKYPTTFIVNVQNLTDEDYWASSSVLGDPRTVAFSMKMEF